jgi:hypothetical protein
MAGEVGVEPIHEARELEGMIDVEQKVEWFERKTKRQTRLWWAERAIVHAVASDPHSR